MSSLAEAYGIKQEMKNISCLLLTKKKKFDRTNITKSILKYPMF